MTSFIAKVRERRAEITAQIAALVAERDELDAVDRVYVRLSGDGADIAGDEPADHFPDAGKMVAADQSTGNVDGSAGRSHSGLELSTESPASAPVDTNSQAKVSTGNGGSNAPLDSAPASGEASRLSGGSGTAAPNSNLQHDAGDRADTDPHSLVGSSNSPEGASDVAADRARKPSVDPGAEPVRQAGGNASASGKSAGGAGASPAAPSLRQRIEDLHKAHPEYTARQAIEALGCTRGSLTGYASILGIKWTRERAAAAEPVEPDPEPEAPEPTPEPERPPAVTPEPAAAYPADSEPETIPSFLPSRAPIAVRPSGSSSAVITKPMAHAPKGTLFYLCDDEGRYLNGSCTGMTTDRTYAWQGSAEQLFNCRKKFPLARDLSERVVSKDMPAPINREVA